MKLLAPTGREQNRVDVGRRLIEVNNLRKAIVVEDQSAVECSSVLTVDDQSGRLLTPNDHIVLRR